MEPVMAGLMPVMYEIAQALMMVLGGFAIWGIKKFAKKVGYEADATQIARVESALMNGLEFGKARILDKAKKSGMDNIMIRNQLALVAAKYVAAQVPSAVKEMKFTPGQLRNWASSILDKKEPATGGVVHVTTKAEG